MVEFIRKRDGRLVPYVEDKIAQAIIKAIKAVGGSDFKKVADITRQVGGILSFSIKIIRFQPLKMFRILLKRS
jgi:ribonucleoside-triphosphate reductase